MEFSIEDVQYYWKAEERRPTDLARLMIVYEAIKEDAEKNGHVKNNQFETKLNILKISEKTGLTQRTVRKNLGKLESLKVIHYHHSANPPRIYLTKDSEERRIVDEMLERARKENLL